MTESTVDDLYLLERNRLTQELSAATRTDWEQQSLCAGWTIRDLAAHLLMPFELTVPGVLRRLVTARFDFDRLADRWARADRRTGTEITAALSVTTADAFNVPGAGERAPLSHLVIHAQDVRVPLGLAGSCGPEAGRLVLTGLTAGRHSVGPHLLTGLHLRATDADWSLGDGPVVEGRASALISALAGRAASAAALAGDGAPELRRRLAI
ncbi:maleylpyruvate isomerase family mycothiol-dependent enzyme [Nakamurella sp. A5-74]|uniref:Maleylpyruvate isomerase family mycothiol-dependent enzyme n=1 Tax=Nakamurella sp. A5-74 TaxID=3158264 RepID=A0AAU8DNS6_9ACTN